MSDTGRLLRTVVQLRPRQVTSRARLRAQRAAFARWGPEIARHLTRSVRGNWGWPGSYVALDSAFLPGAPTPEANAAGLFSFLSESRQLGDPLDWQQASANQLWRFQLHYWEWAWSFARTGDLPWARAAFARLWQSWKVGTTFGRGDAWSPYVTSLRTWALCGLHVPLVQGTDREAAFVADIAAHGSYVAANTEYDVGGNHLVKNLKALIGVGVFLGDDKLIGRAVGRLTGQLSTQVLTDGGHYERSPSYHVQVLGDLLDIQGLLVASDRPSVPGLAEAVQRMREWLACIMLPDSTLPLLNDCFPADGRRLVALTPPIGRDSELLVLEPSGYIVVRKAPWHLIADVGPPCPPDLPAHAHADTLSFVLYYENQPVVIDTGTSEYGDGPRRQYERSTAAHNTIEIDGRSSTEVWSAFRAGRRANATLDRAETVGDKIVVSAGHNGYRGLSGRPFHARTWAVTADAVIITDTVSGRGVHQTVSRLHFNGPVEPAGDGSVRLGRVRISVSGGDVTAVSSGHGDLGQVARGFGLLTPATCIESRAIGALPLRSAVRIAADTHPARP